MKFLPLALTAATLLAADYDILIRNARIIDGSGNPWYRADVGVKAGRIASIGRLNAKTADKIIDAQNRVLTPGFIDVHTHSESGIVQRPQAENFLKDGVTTVVTGNCGGSELELKNFFA